MEGYYPQIMRKEITLHITLRIKNRGGMATIIGKNLFGRLMGKTTTIIIKQDTITNLLMVEDHPHPPGGIMRSVEKKNHHPDRMRRDYRMKRDDRYHLHDERRERSIQNNYYTVPVYNRFELLQRYDEGGRSPRYQQERYGREKTPYCFLETRYRESLRRHCPEGDSQRPTRHTPDPNLERRTKRGEERNQEPQRDQDRKERLRRTPRRYVEKRTGRNEKRDEDAEQVSKNKRKRIVGEGNINISRIELTKEEIKVLDKGRKFAPKKKPK